MRQRAFLLSAALFVIVLAGGIVAATALARASWGVEANPGYWRLLWNDEISVVDCTTGTCETVATYRLTQIGPVTVAWGRH